MQLFDLDKLKAEIVAKLTELYAELGHERAKVAAAITAMTGTAPPDSSDPALVAAAQAAIARLAEVKAASDATAPTG